MDRGRIQGKQSVNLILTVAEIVAPVFLLAGLGFAWVKLGFEYRIQFVTRLAMTFAVPCLVFTALMQSDISPEALSVVSLATITGFAGITLVSWLLLRLAGLPTRSYLQPMFMGNTGNLGLPLCLFAFGDQGFAYAIVIFAISSIYGFSFGVWVVSGGGSPLKVLREPMVGATLLGALFLWQDWQTPQFLTRTLGLIGQMAIPLMLLTLGVAVARLHPGRIPRAVWLSAAKLAIGVALASAVGRLFGLDGPAFGVLVLQLSTPVAVTSYLLTEKYGADSEAVAGMVVVSTLMAVIGLPVLLGFLI
jgi:predicted permease